MNAKGKRSAKEKVPFDPILFAVTVPFRPPAAQDFNEVKERFDDSVEPKNHKTMDAVVEGL